jgi:hypothetical protein
VSLRSFLLILALISLNIDLEAHQRSESFSKWSSVESEDSVNISATFTIKLSVLSKIFPDNYANWESRVINTVLKGFVLPNSCVLADKVESFVSPQNSTMNISRSYICDEILKEIINNNFFDEDQSHSLIARFSNNQTEFPEVLFTSSARSASFETKNQENLEITSFKDYFFLGFNHISSGFDHLAFLLGLILLNRKIKDLLIAVTGFTLGHSLTLALGVLGVVTPLSVWVEAVIGFSIALIALEAIAKETKQFYLYIFGLCLFWIILFLFTLINNLNLSIVGLIGLALFSISYLTLVTFQKTNLSFFITCLFGLVHGFGFGGYLSEVGFAEDRLLNALLGFNVGVEVGQLAILSIIIGVIFIIESIKFNYIIFLRPLLACLLVSLGIFWFLERSL